MNFHMAYFSWIPQNNARLKLSCKFGESKRNPYWHITLTWHELCPWLARLFWPIRLIYDTIWDKAMSKPSWKFGEPKWNPYSIIMLTNSSGTNYVLNEHEDVDRYVSFYNTIWDNAIPKPSWKFGEPKWNPYSVIVLMSSYGTNYVLDEHEDIDWYGSFAIPSKKMLCQSHPESLVNQNENLIDSSC